MKTPSLKIAVGGFGAIGKAVAAALDAGIPGLELVAVSARDTAAARDYMARSFSRAYDVLPLEALADSADVVVECCPALLLDPVARPTLEAGKVMIVISVGALLTNAHLQDIAAPFRLFVMGLVLLIVLRFSPRGLLPEKVRHS